MDIHNFKESKGLFIQTRLGIVTRTGYWFHTNTDAIEEFVPGLLERYSLSKLINDAYTWVRSADSLSLTLLLALLFLINPWLAALITITFHWLWYNFKSIFVNKFLSRLFSFMNSDGYLMMVALIGLSFLGIQGQYLALGIGIVLFFLLKIGVLNWLWNRLADSGRDKLTLNDKVLKMIIIKYAMKEDIAPPSVQMMEDKLRQMAFNRKHSKK